MDLVRVTHVSAHPIKTETTAIDDIRSSIVATAIRLDELNKNIQLTRSMKINDSKIHVKASPISALRNASESPISQIDTIHLKSANSKLNAVVAADNNGGKQSPNLIRVKRIRTTPKILFDEQKVDNNKHE
ncbi:unnamed protein product [Rotaria socialis]|uniref:Uncharacterized protein n=1 Tax=Rotaria socialis TaxID=392032 RepID=A0A817UKA1_9BILA|nr:unnamed protein product [Rotaria socialis]CAF3331220.1 unnamed protein product [Rotaria socialis]CAF3331581.1 unnamed protein product [Rotaria socialis]CAF4137093.1 unnamed protein product [Rotaria socialis]CAF4510498.1 unnamed protein product [Rotaria socialis]